MTKVVIFSGADTSRLETQVNDWLSRNPLVRILHVTQSESGHPDADWALTLTLTYVAPDFAD